MFEPLREITQSAEFTERGWLRLASSHWDDRAIRLELEVAEGRGREAVARWTVACSNVREYLICDADGGGLQVNGSDHPVVRQHIEPRADLFFQGKPSAPTELLGRLWLAHRAIADDWIDFDRYLNLPGRLERLLRRGSGKLASGPRFLLDEYAAVLRAAGVEPSLGGKRATSPKAALWAAHFGDSYVVAEAFVASRR
jgi:hypothetical protein